MTGLSTSEEDLIRDNGGDERDVPGHMPHDASQHVFRCCMMLTGSENVVRHHIDNRQNVTDASNLSAKFELKSGKILERL